VAEGSAGLGLDCVPVLPTTDGGAIFR